MDTQWQAAVENPKSPQRLGSATTSGVDDEQEPLAVAPVHDGCDLPTTRRKERIQVHGGLAPCSPRSLFVSCGGLSIREASLEPDAPPVVAPPQAQDTEIVLAEGHNERF